MSKTLLEQVKELELDREVSHSGLTWQEPVFSLFTDLKRHGEVTCSQGQYHLVELGTEEGLDRYLIISARKYTATPGDPSCQWQDPTDLKEWWSSIDMGRVDMAVVDGLKEAIYLCNCQAGTLLN